MGLILNLAKVSSLIFVILEVTTFVSLQKFNTTLTVMMS